MSRRSTAASHRRNHDGSHRENRLLCCAGVASRGRGALRARAARGRAAGDRQSAGAARPDRLLGRVRQRGVEIPHGDAAERRLPWHPADARRHEDRQRLESCDAGTGAVQSVWRSGDHADSRPPHIVWQDENTLRLDTDAGTQTRLFRFGPGHSRRARRHGKGRRTRGGNPPAPAPERAADRSLSSRPNARPGYLRRNGVPSSADATVTEYFDVARTPRGTVADRHDRRRRSAVPSAAVYRQLALQERDGWLQMGSESVHGIMVRLGAAAISSRLSRRLQRPRRST